MDAGKVAFNSGLSGSAQGRDLGATILQGLARLARPARYVVYVVLELLRPLVVIAGSSMAILGFLLCGFVYCFVAKSHFPMTFTLGFSVGCAAFVVLWQAAIFLADPDSK